IEQRGDRARAQADTPGLQEEVQLQQRRRGHGERRGRARQLTRPTMALIQPEQSVGIDEDHERRRAWNVNLPSAAVVHVHWPAATAGSTISILRPGAGFFRREGSTVKRYSTPRRRMK